MRTAALVLLALAVTVAPMAQAPEEYLAPPGSGRAWAVAVGVSRYQNLSREQWLDYADADALTVSKFLQSGQGLRLRPENLTTLTNDGATRAQIRSMLGTRLVRSIGQGDAVIVFLAAHGMVEREGARDAYIVSYDSSLENLFDTAVQLPELRDILENRLKRASRIFLMLDACRAGKLAEARTFHEEAAVTRRAELFGLLASSPNESSAEGQKFGGGHGAFTYYLLRGLQGEADGNRNGRVEWAEAADFVREQVAAATATAQNPRSFGAPPPTLTLSLAREEQADLGFTAPRTTEVASLILTAPPRTEVRIDGVARGVVPDAGRLEIGELARQNYRLLLATAAGERVVQEVQVSGNPTEVDFNGARVLVRMRAGAAQAAAVERSRGLAAPTPQAALVAELTARFQDALFRNKVVEPAGDSAMDILRRLPAAGAPAAAVQELAEVLSAQLQDDAQQVILAYLKGDAVLLGPDDFTRCAAHYAAAAELESAAPLPQAPAQALPRAPLQARRAFCDARARLYRGDFAGAMPLLEEATRLEPRSALAFNAIGVAYLQQNAPRQAIAPLEAAAARAPRWAYPRFNLALAQAALGQTARAEQEYQRAIQLGPQYPYLHYSLGALYMRINQPARAEQELRRALALDPDLARGHRMLGTFFRSRRREREAETEFRRSLAFHAADIPARLNLARLYRDQRLPAKAEAELLAGLQHVDGAVLRGTLGDVYLDLRRPRDAAEQYRRAAALAPDEASRRLFEEKYRKASR